MEGRKRALNGKWAGPHPSAGRIWPASHMFDTPAVHDFTLAWVLRLSSDLCCCSNPMSLWKCIHLQIDEVGQCKFKFMDSCSSSSQCWHNRIFQWHFFNTLPQYSLTEQTKQCLHLKSFLRQLPSIAINVGFSQCNAGCSDWLRLDKQSHPATQAKHYRSFKFSDTRLKIGTAWCSLGSLPNLHRPTE